MKHYSDSISDCSLMIFFHSFRFIRYKTYLSFKARLRSRTTDQCKYTTVYDSLFVVCFVHVSFITVVKITYVVITWQRSWTLVTAWLGIKFFHLWNAQLWRRTNAKPVNWSTQSFTELICRWDFQCVTNGRSIDSAVAPPHERLTVLPRSGPHSSLQKRWGYPCGPIRSCMNCRLARYAQTRFDSENALTR